LEALLAWSTLFRSGGTLSNYLSFVRTACIICEVDTQVGIVLDCVADGLYARSVQVFDHPGLRKAKASVAKSGLFQRREPQWLQREHVEQLLKLAERRPEFSMMARLFLLAYCFLLRVPSEAIPVRAREGDCCLRLEGDELVLVLKRRKNKPNGSRLVRSCWCSESRTTCPVHVLGPALQRCGDGEMLFPGITAGSALSVLRSMLQLLGVPKAGQFRTHDFRRGHAKDLQLSGLCVAVCCTRRVCACWVSRGAIVADPGRRRMEIASVSCVLGFA
jgi:integrase